MKAILTAVFIFSTFNLYAQTSDKLKDTAEAVTKSFEAFESDYPASTVALFKGVKAAPNDHGVSIKLYLTDGNEISYGCHRHEPADPFECHEMN